MRNGLILMFAMVLTSASPASAAPDTVMGARGQSGLIFLVDDDGSSLGDGYASGLYGVPTNSGSIDLVITGHPDQFFVGAHTQSGAYEVFVDVHDFFGDPIGSFSEVRELLPGTVQEHTWSDLDWIGGTYDAYIDNTVPEPGGQSILAGVLLLLLLRRRPLADRRVERLFTYGSSMGRIAIAAVLVLVMGSPAMAAEGQPRTGPAAGRLT